MASNNRISYPLAFGIVVALVVTMALGWAVAVRQRQATTPVTPEQARVTNWEKLAKDNPQDSGAHIRYAFALYNLALTKKGTERSSLLTRSVAEYDAALKLNPKIQTALFNRAVTLEALGKTDQALAAYESLVKENKGYTQATRLAGNIYLAKGDLKMAIKRLEKAVQTEPTSSDNRIALARAYMKVGKNDKARDQLSYALKMMPDSKDAQALLAQLRKNGGNK
jgi:predicted Zn-dependent protease